MGTSLAAMFFQAEEVDEAEEAAEGIGVFLAEFDGEPLVFNKIEKKEAKPYQVLHNLNLKEK